MLKMLKLKDLYKDRLAQIALDNEFERVTGLPTYGCTLEEARDFRRSKLSAKEWIRC